MEEEGREATGFETAILSVSLVSIWIDGLKRLLVKLSQSIMLPLNIQSFNYQLWIEIILTVNISAQDNFCNLQKSDPFCSLKSAKIGKFRYDEEAWAF